MILNQEAALAENAMVAWEEIVVIPAAEVVAVVALAEAAAVSAERAESCLAPGNSS